MTAELPFRIGSLICRMNAFPPWEVTQIFTNNDAVFSTIFNVGTPIESLIHPEDLPHCTTAVELARKRQQPFQCAYRIRVAHNECIWVSEFGNFVHIDGCEYWDSVITNITQLREDAEIDARAERLAGMSTLAAHFAHHANNMIASVRLCAEMVTIVTRDPEKVLKYTHDAIAAMDQTLPILKSLLTFGQKSGSFSQETIPLSALVALSADLARDALMESPFAARPVNVTLINEAEDIWVRGNSVALQRVVCQLVLNAAEWMAQGGEVRIRAAMTEITAEQSRRMVATRLTQGPCGMIEVIDTGSGISPDDLSYIFDPYFTRRPNAVKGSGFGLSIVYGTLILNYCGLEIDTSPAGTTFRIFIPLTDKPGGRP